MSLRSTGAPGRCPRRDRIRALHDDHERNEPREPGPALPEVRERLAQFLCCVVVCLGGVLAPPRRDLVPDARPLVEEPECDVDRYSVTWDPSPDASFSTFTCAQLCDTRARRWLYMKRDAPKCDDSARSCAVDGSILYRDACVTSTRVIVPCTPDNSFTVNHHQPSLPRGSSGLGQSV